jgi:surfeit locus 1 family protein
MHHDNTTVPKLITPEHDYSKRPLQLFWLDRIALKAIAEESEEEETIYMTQVTNNQDIDDVDDDDDDKTRQSQQQLIQYPLVPPVKAMAEFKTTPMIHIGYATTWYGLSAAGIYMTRKLITRGRG